MVIRETVGIDVCSACVLLRTVQGSDVKRTGSEHVGGGEPNIVYIEFKCGCRGAEFPLILIHLP